MVAGWLLHPLNIRPSNRNLRFSRGIAWLCQDDGDQDDGDDVIMEASKEADGGDDDETGMGHLKAWLLFYCPYIIFTLNILFFQLGCLLSI